METGERGRVPGVDPDAVSDEYVRSVFAAQTRAWGAPLLNHLVYARRPALFRGVRGMWTALGTARLEPALVALVNRRVAALNRCAF